MDGIRNFFKGADLMQILEVVGAVGLGIGALLVIFANNGDETIPVENATIYDGNALGNQPETETPFEDTKA